MNPDARATSVIAPLTGRRVGVFEVLGLLGAGGMGEVYRARDTRLGRDVAIKILSPALRDDGEHIARFEREARVLASLSHPHIGVVHGLEDVDGRQALVMELVEGENLAERLARGPLPVNEALEISSQVAEALEAAHAQGTAKSLAWSGDTVTATRAGAITGTLAYMSPEQTRGEPVDTQTDIVRRNCSADRTRSVMARSGVNTTSRRTVGFSCSSARAPASHRTS